MWIGKRAVGLLLSNKTQCKQCFNGWTTFGKVCLHLFTVIFCLLFSFKPFNGDIKVWKKVMGVGARLEGRIDLNKWKRKLVVKSRAKRREKDERLDERKMEKWRGCEVSNPSKPRWRISEK